MSHAQRTQFTYDTIFWTALGVLVGLLIGGVLVAFQI